MYLNINLSLFFLYTGVDAIWCHFLFDVGNTVCNILIPMLTTYFSNF